MKRIFRINGHRRFYGLGYVVVLSIVIGGDLLSNSWRVQAKSAVSIPLVLMCIGLSIWSLLDLFVQKLIANDVSIQTFNLINRQTNEIPYETITSYSKEPRIGWTLKQGEQVVRLPRIDRPDFHSLIAEKAPEALKAKLWKCGQIPPIQNFEALPLFEWNNWMSNALGAGFLALVASIISKWVGAGYFLSAILQISYQLKDLVGRLDITSEGVVARWPWAKRSIGWEEVSAVFCDRGSDGNSYFVVTAPERAITVPAHVLTDPEARRKFFYSIPDATRCVNFETIQFRRRGRGKKIPMGEESFGTLEPVGPLPM